MSKKGAACMTGLQENAPLLVGHVSVLSVEAQELLLDVFIIEGETLEHHANPPVLELHSPIVVAIIFRWEVNISGHVRVQWNFPLVRSRNELLPQVTVCCQPVV
jgi:hypothetical protein